MRSRLRRARVLDGDSTTAIPSCGHASASAAIASEPVIGSAGSADGAGRGSGSERSDSPTCATSSSQRERYIADDRVAHRRPGRLVRIARDGHERRALG